ncbi:HD domain-containing protein [Paraburkholderia aspalathi]|nr:HD domain-containing protein [Paraburkholderia aspalathi]MBK3779987.1 HD domain-containing protein [Paraburkholderia aspalathi]
MERLLDAIKFAEKGHAGQKRRGSGADYITHPIAVSYLVAAFKRSKHLVDLLIAAILHDVLEDTELTFEEIARRFGAFVASLVYELKNDDEEIERVGKLEYQSRKVIGISSYALVIKLCDRLHNISDQPTKNMVRDTVELMTRLRAGRKLSKTHKALVAEIERLCAERQAEWELKNAA